jgi:ABC-type transporter Mla maintaining outer membrane lipid asymmetry permease subunit MlaE
MSVVALWLLVWIIILLFTDINRLHVLWIIPVGALIIPRLYDVIIKIPILRNIVLIAATTLRSIVWIGIDKNKREAEIKKYLHKITKETSRDFWAKNKK